MSEVLGNAIKEFRQYLERDLQPTVGEDPRVLIKDAWLALQNSLHSETYKQGTLCKGCLVQGRLQSWLESNRVFLGNPNDGR